MALRARNLHLRYDRRPILEGVDFGLETGESVALLGPNGAGKSTLLKLLAGLIPADQGEVLIDDVALTDLPRREVARKIAVVQQARPDAFHFTALEYVLMGFHAQNARFALESAAQRQEAMAALEEMEVATLAAQPFSTLSGGEAQRVLFARTRVMKAPYWLLDEPVANLDPRHRYALLEVIRRHAEGPGACVAIVHDLGQLERWFDRAVVLASGTVVFDGPPAELSEELVAEVYGIELSRTAEGLWALPARARNAEGADEPRPQHTSVRVG